MEITARQSYNQICAAWAEYRDSMPVNACIAEFVKPLPRGAEILDIGCGTGCPIDRYLAEQGFLVHGIDISDEMIARAEALTLPGASFTRCDFLDYEPQQTFDAVIAFDSLWHVPYEKQRMLYPKLSRLLHRGGILLFTSGKEDGGRTGTMFDAPFSYSSLDLGTMETLLSQNNLRITRCIEDYSEPTTGTRDLLITAVKQ